MCIYNLFASIVTPDDEKGRKKKEKRSKLLYIFLSSLDLTAHPILFYSRWGNLRALTKWESIISVPFNPVARRSPLWTLPTPCSSFFFSFIWHENFHNNTTAGWPTAAAVSTSFDQNFQSTKPKKKCTPYFSFVFYFIFFGCCRDRGESSTSVLKPSSTGDVNYNLSSQRGIGGALHFSFDR